MTEREQLLQAINQGLVDLQPKRRGPIPAPAIINDNQADPALRRGALKQYASAVLETPTQDWSPEMRSAVMQECANVVREMGQ
ncbi:MAG TPA: hypothetical protein VFA33_22515 [Bryobacteraceae bacterium]|nr:hypothetical protein [Bryobacteraceae bacterium]